MGIEGTGDESGDWSTPPPLGKPSTPTSAAIRNAMRGIRANEPPATAPQPPEPQLSKTEPNLSNEGIAYLTEGLTVTDWVERTTQFHASVAEFMRERIAESRQDSRSTDYDMFNEFHISGSDGNVFTLIEDGNALQFIKVFYRSGVPEKMHFRVDGSTNDVYISGRALNDFGLVHKRLHEKD